MTDSHDARAERALLTGDTLRFPAGTVLAKPDDGLATLSKPTTMEFRGGRVATEGPYNGRPVMVTGRGKRWTQYPLDSAEIVRSPDRVEVTWSWRFSNRVAWAVGCPYLPPLVPELPVCVDCARIPSGALSGCWRHESLRAEYVWAAEWEQTCSFGGGHHFDRDSAAWEVRSQQGVKAMAYMRCVCSEHLYEAIEWALGHSTIIPGSTALG